MNLNTTTKFVGVIKLFLISRQNNIYRKFTENVQKSSMLLLKLSLKKKNYNNFIKHDIHTNMYESNISKPL